MYEQLLRRAGGAETAHADKPAILADIALPALAHGRFHRDPDSTAADHLASISLVLLLEQFPARHRDDGCGDAVGLQHGTGLQCYGHLRSGREDRGAPRTAAFRLREHVGASA